MQKHLNFNYDYSSCMVMKLGMAFPDMNRPGKSHVLMTFEEVLSYIQKIDNMTPGITKIYNSAEQAYFRSAERAPQNRPRKTTLSFLND